ncbi:MAG: hypothetical protein U0M15_01285 [Bacillota bacterium]|nr:hypothetical protein [Bacillota bacterium]
MTTKLNEGTFRERFFRTNTKSLIGAVIMGIVFLIMMQVTGRIDGVLDPNFLLFNGSCFAFFTGLIFLMYRQPAGIIAGLVEALVAMATAYSALAVVFLVANVVGSLVYSFIAIQFSMEKWWQHILAQFGCAFSANACIMLGLVYLMGLPWGVAAFCQLINSLVGTVAAGILTKIAYDGLKRTNLLG